MKKLSTKVEDEEINASAIMKTCYALTIKSTTLFYIGLCIMYKLP